MALHRGQTRRLRALGCTFGQGYFFAGHLAGRLAGAEVAAGAFDALVGASASTRAAHGGEVPATVFRAPFGRFASRPIAVDPITA